MTPKLMIGCAIVALFTSCSQLGQNELNSSSPRADEIRSKMKKTVIPDVDLENVTTEEALRVWSEKSREFQPLHFKFPYNISYPMTFSRGTAPTKAAPPRVSKVTVRRKKITSKRLLEEICHQSNMEWMISGRVILVRPSKTPATTAQ